MASDGNPGQIPVASLVQGSPAATSNGSQSGGGRSLPQGGNSNAPNGASTVPTAIGTAARAGVTPAATSAQAAVYAQAAAPAVTKTPVQPTTDPETLVQNLNKFLNDSGMPDQFRLDPASGGKRIQQINPATGAVVGEFLVAEFPALARSVGVPGLLIDSRA